MSNLLTTPFGTDALDLRRYPVRPDELLQAWDAADELVLEHVAALAPVGKKILIVGDTFGALSVALAHFGVTTYTDSFVGAAGIRANTTANARPSARLIDRLSELEGAYDLVLVRVPKNLSFFEDILAELSSHLAPGAKIVAGVMVKHQSAGAFDLTAKYFGETSTSLAKKKARLIFATFSKSAVATPYPLHVPMDGFKTPFVNHSNVFSREKLDIGTRFFLENLPQGPFRTVLDLGCGNGIVGIKAKQLHPEAKVIFTDDSRMAILSAEANFRANFPAETAEFHWTDGFAEAAAESVDLVLCNPPFHEGNTVGDSIALRMFADAHHALRPDGILRVIGNTHLQYGMVLQRGFGNARKVASNGKFTVLESIR
jgi:23S rRNA (guanine1835-N2)-methyltransferase